MVRHRKRHRKPKMFGGRRRRAPRRRRQRGRGFEGRVRGRGLGEVIGRALQMVAPSQSGGFISGKIRGGDTR